MASPMMSAAMPMTSGGLAFPLRGWAFPYLFNGSFEYYARGAVNFNPTFDAEVQNADEQYARGITPLGWAYCWEYPRLQKADPKCTGKNCTVANRTHAIETFASQAVVNHSRPGMTSSVLGRGLDECNRDNMRFAEERELAASGFRLARRRQPKTLIAAWGANAGDKVFASLMRDGTFDLAMIEGYTYCPGCDSWPAPANGCCPVGPIENAVEAYSTRLDFARANGYLNRTVFCFGFLLGQSTINPYGWTGASLRIAMRKLKAEYPELAGVIMYGMPPRRGFPNATRAGTPESDRATTKLIQEANDLMLEMWPSREAESAAAMNKAAASRVTAALVTPIRTPEESLAGESLVEESLVEESLAELSLAEEGRPWMNRMLPPEARAKALVERMHASEKLVLLEGSPSTCNAGGTSPAGTRPPWVAGCTASIPRLGVRSFRLEDGPNGVGDWNTNVTAFPSALTVVASWDVGLMRRYAAMAAEEQRAKGNHVMLGPGLNLARVPLNGRNFEYFGEDPLLAARMAAASVAGIQSEGVVACAKHWVDNNQEGPLHNGRLDTSSNVGGRANRELYYAPFEGAIAAGAGAIMCSYNLINTSGTPTYSCESHESLTGVLKGDLNFTGWVVSDWGADHGSVASINAGMDQTMSASFSDATRAAILSGAVPQSRIDDAARRVLTPLFRVGAFDRTDYGNISADVTSPRHTAVAQELAEQSAVLLKNEASVLPLSATDSTLSIAVVGDANNVKGGGSGSVWSRHIISPAEGIRARVAPTPASTSSTPPRVTNHSVEYHACGMGQCNQSACTTIVTDADIQASVALARSARVAIVSVAVTSTEGYDRFNLSLGPQQDRLVREVAAVNARTIVVVRCPGAVLMPWLPLVQAVIVQFLPGQESGHALASLIFGDTNPSGKLPLSFPAAESQTWLTAGGVSSYPGILQPGKTEPHYIATYNEALHMGCAL